MCYGDIAYGNDGYYRQWAEELERRAEEQRQAEEQQMMEDEDYLRENGYYDR